MAKILNLKIQAAHGEYELFLFPEGNSTLRRCVDGKRFFCVGDMAPRSPTVRALTQMQLGEVRRMANAPNLPFPFSVCENLSNYYFTWECHLSVWSSDRAGLRTVNCRM